MTVFWAGLFLVGWMLAAGVYLLAKRRKLMALVDLIWTTGLGLAAMAYGFAAGLEGLRPWLILGVLVFWSLRISGFLFRDRVLRGHEDPRYENLAKHWGESAPRNFLLLFLLQVPLVALFLLPVSVAAGSGSEWKLFDLAAIAIALAALFGEAVADRQLARFRQDPENSGKVCRDGLWRYSRHPNYFFEWLHWWAYVAFAIGSPSAWLTLLGPAAMYVFLRYLTGIPHAERSSLARRGDAYRDYQRTTSAFFPWIPREPQS